MTNAHTDATSPKNSPQPAGALAGIRVIEIGTTIAGPACGRMLADFGADVIKIEPHNGDPVRQMGRHKGDVSLYGASILRGKRSVVLDLKTEQGRALALSLIDRADVVLENNRPGVLERMGLGYAAVSGRKPAIIYARISGYGQDGPYAARPGYGAICEAFGGVRHLTGDPDRPPARVALATTDYLTAVYAAFGVLAALRHRDLTGVGQSVDVALYEAAFSQMESVVTAYDQLREVPARQGPNLPSMAPNSLYPTRNGGFVLIAANSDPTFTRLAKAMGRADFLVDARFASIRTRGLPHNMKALDAEIAAWTVQQDGAALETLLLDAGVPASRAFTVADIFADPHYRARDMLCAVPHPQLGTITQVGVVPKLSATPGSIRHTGPALGADTWAVLRDELGMTPDALRALADQRVIGAPTAPAQPIDPADPTAPRN